MVARKKPLTLEILKILLKTVLDWDDIYLDRHFDRAQIAQNLPQYNQINQMLIDHIYIQSCRKLSIPDKNDYDVLMILKYVLAQFQYKIISMKDPTLGRTQYRITPVQLQN